MLWYNQIDGGTDQQTWILGGAYYETVNRICFGSYPFGFVYGMSS